MTLIIRTPELASAKRVLPAPQHKSPNTGGNTLSEIVDVSANAAANVSAGQTNVAGAPDQSSGELNQLIAREQLIEQRLRAVEEAEQRAYDEGYQSGLRSGEEEGRDAYVSGLRQLEELTQNLNASIERSLDVSEDMMVAIVFESVCKIVGDALVTKEGVTSVVKEALTKVRGKSAVVIRVNPVDLELIEEGSAFGIASEADWRADDSVPMGGCMIESEYGTLDARIDTQLNQLKRALLAAHHKPNDIARGE